MEFVRLVSRPGRWLLVSVKFLEEKREAWVNSAYPLADAHYGFPVFALRGGRRRVTFDRNR
ncbi:MAG: hypothetical protein HYT81_05480 [Gemmatimonadetes bacterium]|nr:hypothetical protein [Gemmatimonadota bacterium]MBI2404141.1 hypothetical protein [Gemmatimonadota bacterium]